MLQCDPLAESYVRHGIELPNVTTNKMLLLDVTSPNVKISDWQQNLVASQQATSEEDLVWLACLQEDTEQRKCEYDRGPSLNYTSVVMNIRLVYAREENFSEVDRLFGSAPYSCPNEIHMVNNAIDYVVMDDGSKVNYSELHLDEEVTYEQTMSKVNEMIDKYSFQK